MLLSLSHVRSAARGMQKRGGVSSRHRFVVTVASILLLLQVYLYASYPDYLILFYLILSAAAIYYMAFNAPKTPPRPFLWLFIAKATLLLFYLVIADFSTAGALSYLITADICLVALTSYFQDRYSSEGTFRIILGGYTFVLIAGIAIGLFLPNSIPTDPVMAVLSGGRLNIFSLGKGHSIIIVISFLFVTVGLSNITKQPISVRITFVVIGVVLGLLSKSLLGYFSFFAPFVVTFLVRVVRRKIIVTPILTIMFCANLMMLFNMIDLGDMFYSLRMLTNQYSDNRFLIANEKLDPTSGRSELNALLLPLSLSSPIVGVGNNHPYILYGSNLDQNSGSKAYAESGLRIAAKYGLIYFALLIYLLYIPILLEYSSEGVKILVLSTAIYSSALLCFNGFLLERPNNYAYMMCYGFLLYGLMNVSARGHTASSRMAATKR